MATKLEKELKRELDIDGKAYMLTISPTGLKLTVKFEFNTDTGLSQQKIEETKSALRELGLDDTLNSS